MDVNRVTMEFSGKRNVVTKLSPSNVGLTVDLSEITRTGNRTGVYQLPYEIEYPTDINESNVNLVNASVDYVAVTVEKLVTNNIEVRGINECSIAAGYQSEPMQFDPETITVSGAEAIVSTVDHAQVTLNRQNVSGTVEEEVDVVLVDALGQEIPQDNLTLSETSVFVTLPIVMVKEVPLSVNFVYGNSATEDNMSYEIDPPVVTLSGDPEILNDINQLSIGTIDLTSFTTSMSESFTITVPNDVENLSGETTATVQVEVLNMATARISATNITTRNAPENNEVNIITQSLDVLLRGPENLLGNITSDNIRIVADLSELGGATGTMSVSAKVYIDGYSDVDAIGTYRISVEVS
jgi:YbbR domain-containing protein